MNLSRSQIIALSHMLAGWLAFLLLLFLAASFFHEPSRSEIDRMNDHMLRRYGLQSSDSPQDTQRKGLGLLGLCILFHAWHPPLTPGRACKEHHENREYWEWLS